MGPGRRRPEARCEASWGGGPGVTDPAVVAGLLHDADPSGAELVERATHPETKLRLRRQTERAVERGLFGVPTVLADGELFWGYDAFGHLETLLAGDDPLEADALARWRDLPASARR